MKRLFKQLFFGSVCVIALATVSSCGKESTESAETVANTPADNDINSEGFVDLGLPSGTKWKASNETILFNYDIAVNIFGSRLPTKEQYEELLSKCERTLVGENHCDLKLTGPSGKSITLPAEGCLLFSGYMLGAGTNGYYWTSTPYDSNHAWILYFDSDRLLMENQTTRWNENSVRLVQD